MSAPRLHWTRGRADEGGGVSRTLEWIGLDDAGAPIARVVRLRGPVLGDWRRYAAVPLDEEARIVELRPPAPAGAAWLAYIGGKVVGRAALPLQAVRTAEAALAGRRRP